jgi:hypothetical protein
MGQAHLATTSLAQPAEPFGPRMKHGRSSPPSAPASRRRNTAGRWPVGGRGVAGEQADGVTNWFGGQKEGRGSPEGFSVAEGINDREKTMASQSRGHWRGLSSLGGSTQRRGTWGGVEVTREGLEQLFAVAQVGRRGTTAVA